MQGSADTTEALTAILERLDAIACRTPQRFMSLRSAESYADLSQDSLRRLNERGELTFHRPRAWKDSDRPSRTRSADSGIGQ